MRTFMEIAGRFGLLALVFLSVVLLAFGIGAALVGDPGKLAATPSPPTVEALVVPGRPPIEAGARARAQSEGLEEPESVAPVPLASAAGKQKVPHFLWSTPFVFLLLAIALLPMVPKAHHWWERNSTKLVVGLALSSVVLAHYGLRAPPGTRGRSN
jgi:hypothetical protein